MRFNNALRSIQDYGIRSDTKKPYRITAALECSYTNLIQAIVVVNNIADCISEPLSGNQNRHKIGILVEYSCSVSAIQRKSLRIFRHA